MSSGEKLRLGYHNLCRPEILSRVPTTAKKILDLGCGTGELGKALKKRQQCHVTGIEINKEAFETARENLDRALHDNLNRYDPTLETHKYDCIVLADILEHLINPWSVLIKFSKVLTTDGVLIASVPNVAHPTIIDQLQRGLFRYAQAGILDITHLRFFTKTSISQVFYRAGLKITSINSHPAKDNPIQHILTAVKPILEHAVPETTILILTCNGWKFTKQCLDSIKKRTAAPYKILVIDNGSTDETVAELRKDKSIYHIENTYNHGFARGFNIGLDLIDTKYFVLCNSDIIVTPKWLSSLITHINYDKDIMLIGPKSNYVSGPQEDKTVTYKNETEMLEHAKDLSLITKDRITYFFRVVFFCTLFKSIVLKKVGLLDEGFLKGNYEDDDYCMRVATKKLKAAHDNTVFIHHWGRKTFVANKLNYEKELTDGRKFFMDKWNLTEYGPATTMHFTEYKEVK